jgi:hypothetical protein
MPDWTLDWREELWKRIQQILHFVRSDAFTVTESNEDLPGNQPCDNETVSASIVRVDVMSDATIRCIYTYY